MKYARTVALLALAAGMTPGLERLTSTYTMPHQEPDNRGRRAEKSAERLAKAEEKRKRRAAKRLAPNVELTGDPRTEHGDTNETR